jgi:outer membrane putative beta-barrel porin/alpha-amylase
VTRRVLIFVVLLMINFSINAQTIITDRPDQTESSSTIPKGSFQIESGVLFGSSKNEGISIRETLAPSTLFRYGITKGIEIRLVNQFESIKNRTTSQKANGISDLEIGTKFQILQKEGINTEIAFVSHLILPTGSKELTVDNFGTINKLSISHGISETVGIGYNVGYNYFGTGKGNFTYSLSFAFELTSKLGIYIEPYGNLIELDQHEASFDAGITYLAQDNLQLDVSFGTGINHTMNYFSIGASINISKNKKEQ